MKNSSKIIIMAVLSIAGIVLFGISDGLIHNIDRFNAIQNYKAVETTCNDANAEPDGECFIDAFNECKSASIKQMGFTFEGDPIFYYAHIILSEPCTISFTLDASQDTWTGQNKEPYQEICTSPILNDRGIDLLCNDDEKAILPLH